MTNAERLGGYYYISNRLVSRVVKMPEVRQPRGRLVLSEMSAEVTATDGPKLGVKAARQEPHESLQQRAVRATQVLRPQTGTVDQPSKPYLRMRLDAYMSTFNVPLGWDWDGIETDREIQSVMLLSSGQTVMGKRMFVGLLGSARNLMSGDVGRPVGYTQGRTPSDIDSLYELFSQIRESRDARVEGYRVERSRKMPDLELARDAMSLAQGSPGDGPPRRVEVLFRRHRPALTGSIDLDPDFLAPYNLVLIGAPLWIREVTTEDGAPAQPSMDRIGDASHRYYNTARLKSLEIAHRAISANIDLNALDDRMKELTAGKTTRSRSGSEDLSTDPHQIVDQVHEARSVRATALEEYAAHEQDLIERVGKPAEWPAFAEWFVAQSCLEGIPLVALSVERKPSLWRRLRRRAQLLPPEQTGIAGVVVTVAPEDPATSDRYLKLGSYRDAQFRDLSFQHGGRDLRYFFVTPAGDIYPVTIWSFHFHDSRARVVYSDARSEGGLKRNEQPQPDLSLIDSAVPAMLEASMRWRITFKRSVPEVPWLDNSGMLSRFGPPAGAPPPTVTDPRIDQILGNATADVALDDE